MNNAFFKLLRRAHIPPQTLPWSLTSSYSTPGEAVLDPPCLSLVPLMLGLIKVNIKKYIMTSVNMSLFLECTLRLEHVNKYS